MSREGQAAIESEGDIVQVRKTVREEAGRLGFGITDVTRIVTAASELARNVFLYAGSGYMRWRAFDAPRGTCLELLFVDEGPGIPDVEAAMAPGYSTGGGLGLGLAGTKRLVDEMEISSEVGRGTRVMVRKWMKGDGSAATGSVAGRGGTP